ncbi:hypothetical protein BM613_13425 [Sulfoacidibacillus thermotolerans]|uniref:Uncharacterized protein n=1 Tax=Sulfoacidibacillus thermotolerans TaxID=1765684 RepID=A0A2U3D1M8_SULT2|nr:hypothetical protein BM613_13425 [Sulfoacidibacillus thermotolerans]
MLILSLQVIKNRIVWSPSVGDSYAAACLKSRSNETIRRFKPSTHRILNLRNMLDEVEDTQWMVNIDYHFQYFSKIVREYVEKGKDIFWTSKYGASPGHILDIIGFSSHKRYLNEISPYLSGFLQPIEAPNVGLWYNEGIANCIPRIIEECLYLEKHLHVETEIEVLGNVWSEDSLEELVQALSRFTVQKLKLKVSMPWNLSYDLRRYLAKVGIRQNFEDNRTNDDNLSSQIASFVGAISGLETMPVGLKKIVDFSSEESLITKISQIAEYLDVDTLIISAVEQDKVEFPSIRCIAMGDLHWKITTDVGVVTVRICTFDETNSENLRLFDGINMLNFETAHEWNKFIKNLESASSWRWNSRVQPQLFVNACRFGLASDCGARRGSRLFMTKDNTYESCLGAANLIEDQIAAYSIEGIQFSQE